MPSRRKVILMWTPAFNEEKPFLGDDCPLRDRCELTYAKSRLSEADTLVFHVPDINFHHWPNETALHGKRVPRVFFTQETAPNLFKYWQAAKLPSESARLCEIRPSRTQARSSFQSATSTGQ